MEASKHIKNLISWTNSIDMDREDFLETLGKILLELEGTIKYGYIEE